MTRNHRHPKTFNEMICSVFNHNWTEWSLYEKFNFIEVRNCKRCHRIQLRAKSNDESPKIHIQDFHNLNAVSITDAMVEDAEHKLSKISAWLDNRNKQNG